MSAFVHTCTFSILNLGPNMRLLLTGLKLFSWCKLLTASDLQIRAYLLLCNASKKQPAWTILLADICKPDCGLFLLGLF